MKYLLIILSLSVFKLNAQSHEFSLGVGTASYYGDLSPSNTNTSFFEPLTTFDIKNIKMGYTGEYRYNFRNYFSIGVDLSHMYVSAYDSDNNSTQLYDRAFYRKIRNLSFYSDIDELNVNFRYEPFRNENEWDVNKFHFSPYIGLGIGVFHFNPKTMYGGNEVQLQPLGTEGQGLPGRPSKYNLTQLCFPVLLGMKMSLPNKKATLSIEAGYRYTTTDYLDDVSTSYVGPTVFNSYYSSSEAAIINALAERRLEIDPSNTYSYITAAGQKRGTSKYNDSYITILMRLSFIIPNRKGTNYDCYKFNN